ncbi:MAG: DNA double-strand break repair nuclease NurA [archaeon GB-1867-035]|nr:DNA double-strand break repair nuclease NurA [Candidatus Culexmicrobium profundum]
MGWILGEVLRQVLKLAKTLTHYAEEERVRARSHLKPALSLRKDERSPYIRQVDLVEAEGVVAIDAGYNFRPIGRRLVYMISTSIVDTFQSKMHPVKEINEVLKSPGAPETLISLMAIAHHFTVAKEYIFKLPSNFNGVFLIDGPLLPHLRLTAPKGRIAKKCRRDIENCLAVLLHESVKRNIPLAFLIKESESRALIRFLKLERVFREEGDADALFWIMNEGEYTSAIRLWPEPEVNLRGISKLIRKIEERYVRSFGKSFPSIYLSYLKVRKLLKPVAIQFPYIGKDWNDVLLYQHDLLSKIYALCRGKALPLELLVSDYQSRVSTKSFAEVLDVLATLIKDDYVRAQLLGLMGGELHG